MRLLNISIAIISIFLSALNSRTPWGAEGNQYNTTEIPASVLLSTCKPETQMYCSIYAFGLRDGLLVGQLYNSKCLPDLYSISQMVDDIKEFVEKNPQSKDMYIGSVALAALKSKYPCE